MFLLLVIFNIDCVARSQGGRPPPCRGRYIEFAAPLSPILLVAGIILYASALGTGETRAQEIRAPSWPQRTVKLIVPLSPGTGTDVTARLYADRLSQRWGQPVVVENRPGADAL